MILGAESSKNKKQKRTEQTFPLYAEAQSNPEVRKFKEKGTTSKTAELVTICITSECRGTQKAPSFRMFCMSNTNYTFISIRNREFVHIFAANFKT